MMGSFSIPGVTHCKECGEKLTANSACYDGYGEPRVFCTNPECEKNPMYDYI